MVKVVINFTVNKLANGEQVKSLLVLRPEGVGKTSWVTAAFCAARDMNVHGYGHESFFRIRGPNLPSHSFENSMRECLFEVDDCAPSAIFVEDAVILFVTDTQYADATRLFVNHLKAGVEPLLGVENACGKVCQYPLRKSIPAKEEMCYL